ncbi:MAG: ATP-grasp domain-containing protein [Promethearchaeota archaeon]|jgi:hypothetical protein
MKIGILSKRKTMLTGEIRLYLENKGFEVSIYTLENLVINDTLLNSDFYILKSKNLFFLYAGYFLEANNKPILPKPQISFIQKNRIQSHLVLKRAGIKSPKIYLGTPDTARKQIESDRYPLILKPIMGSGSKGVELIRSSMDFPNEVSRIVYLETYITGIHYNVYFIDNEICTLIKPPLSHEHVEMEKIKTPKDIRAIIKKWKKFFKGEVLFGHLDMVREELSNQLYVVDAGSFPEFSNWKCAGLPVEKICNLIIKQVEKVKIR